MTQYKERQTPDQILAEAVRAILQRPEDLLAFSFRADPVDGGGTRMVLEVTTTPPQVVLMPTKPDPVERDRLKEMMERARLEERAMFMGARNT